MYCTQLLGAPLHAKCTVGRLLAFRGSLPAAKCTHTYTQSWPAGLHEGELETVAGFTSHGQRSFHRGYMIGQLVAFGFSLFNAHSPVIRVQPC